MALQCRRPGTGRARPRGRGSRKTETNHMRMLLLVVAVALIVGAVPAPARAQDAVRTGEIVKIAADAKSLVVKTARGETNVLITAETVVKEGEKTLKVADLKVGDAIKVTGVRKEADVEAKEIDRTPK